MIKRVLLLPLLAVTVVLTACSPTPPSSGDAAVSAGMPVPGSDVVEKVVVTDESASQSRIIEITTDNFVFTPNSITAKKGEKVKVRLTGIAGIHGFAVPDLGINTSVSAGQTVDVELPTDTVGTFNFLCSIPCGSGHQNMKGTITIEQ